jgi:enamine deaminase RidA (YjgF/YER057c/UK114 family)
MKEDAMPHHRELMNPPELHPAPGFSHMALAECKRFAFIAGQVALDREFNLVGDDDLGAQTHAAMENLKLALEAAGAGWDDVVRRTIYAHSLDLEEGCSFICSAASRRSRSTSTSPSSRSPCS